MKKLALILIAISSLLSGCIIYDGPNRGGGYRGDHSNQSGPGPSPGDRDRDGVPDQHDRKPNNPNRY